MGYALFADRKLYYQNMVNDLNYRLECVIMDKRRLLDKQTRADEWLDMQTGMSIFDGVQYHSFGGHSGNTPALDGVNDGGQTQDDTSKEIEAIKNAAATGVIPEDEAKRQISALENKKATQQNAHIISPVLQRNYEYILGAQADKWYQDFRQKNGKDPSLAEFEAQYEELGDAVAVRVHKRQVEWLKREDNILDLKQKRLETKLAAANQSLQAVIQAEGQAIQQSAPKFAGLG